MEGFVAVDGGRDLKAGLLAFGALIWTAPLAAQSQDPLAPLQTKPQPESPPPATSPTPSPTVIAPQIQPAAPTASVAAPRDWRGLFDAIDSGNWAAAQAGIAALPQS